MHKSLMNAQGLSEDSISRQLIIQGDTLRIRGVGIIGGRRDARDEQELRLGKLLDILLSRLSGKTRTMCESACIGIYVG